MCDKGWNTLSTWPYALCRTFGMSTVTNVVHVVDSNSVTLSDIEDFRVNFYGIKCGTLKPDFSYCSEEIIRRCGEDNTKAVYIFCEV